MRNRERDLIIQILHRNLCVVGKEFVNFKFEPGELVHGERYTICLHTEYTEIQFEMWKQILPELNTCSDGIVVDLTPPTPGKVWIGNVQGTSYQVCDECHSRDSCSFISQRKFYRTVMKMKGAASFEVL